MQQVVRNRHVNMIDLIQWGREDDEGKSERVQVFQTVQELSDYSRKTGKIYDKRNLERRRGGGVGVVLRHLLRNLFPVKELSIEAVSEEVVRKNGLDAK